MALQSLRAAGPQGSGEHPQLVQRSAGSSKGFICNILDESVCESTRDLVGRLASQACSPIWERQRENQSPENQCHRCCGGSGCLNLPHQVLAEPASHPREMFAKES